MVEKPNSSTTLQLHCPKILDGVLKLGLLESETNRSIYMTLLARVCTKKLVGHRRYLILKKVVIQVNIKTVIKTVLSWNPTDRISHA